MKKLLIQLAEFDTDLLHEEIEEAIGTNQFWGLSTGPSGIVLYIGDTITEADIEKVTEKHDPKIKKSKIKVKQEALEAKEAWLLTVDLDAIRTDVTDANLSAAMTKLIDVVEALHALKVG